MDKRITPGSYLSHASQTPEFEEGRKAALVATTTEAVMTNPYSPDDGENRWLNWKLGYDFVVNAPKVDPEVEEREAFINRTLAENMFRSWFGSFNLA